MYGKKTWSEFSLESQLIKNLKALNCKRPTVIQEQAVDAAMRGMDVLGAAPTGSGKTLAFCVPLVNWLMKRLGEEEMKQEMEQEMEQEEQEKEEEEEMEEEEEQEEEQQDDDDQADNTTKQWNIYSVIISPTRELALQTSRVLTRLCNKTPIRFMLYFSYDS